VAEVDLGVGPRRDVGEDEVAGAGPGGGLAGLAAVEVQVGDVLLAVREGRLARSSRASLTPVSPEYVRDRPPCSRRMA
jgi:hypothetical protein